MKDARIAILLVAGTVALSGVAPGISCAQGTKEAKQRFEKGVKLFKKGDHEGALVEFRAAYDAEPNTKVRYNIGMTLYKLNRYVEADAELRSYLDEGGDQIPEGTLTEVQAILFEIQAYIGTVVPTCDTEEAKIYVAGVLVGALPLSEPLRLDVGEYVIEVRAAGFDPISKKVSVPGGKEVEVAFEFHGEAGAVPPTPPPAAGCSLDLDCPQPERCDHGSCVPVEDRPGKKRGSTARRLLVSGSILAPLGLCALVPGIVSFNFGWYGLGVALTVGGAIMIGTGIPLIIMGAVLRKRLQKESASLRDGILALPYASVVPGGVTLGMIVGF